MPPNLIKKSKTLILFSILMMFWASCTSLQPIDQVENADDDDFFLMVMSSISETAGISYVRIWPKDVNGSLLDKIQKVILATESVYAIGNVYSSSFVDNNVNYTVFLMDTVTDHREFMLTPGGEKFYVNLGTKACKWVLFRAAGSNS
jgi:hypothetical protein